MAITTRVVARQYLDVVADAPLQVGFPLLATGHAKVYYGNAGVLAVTGTHYTITLGDPFDTFTLTPTQALIDAINALIAADPTEVNRVVVRSTVDYNTSVSQSNVNEPAFLASELDLMTLRLNQLEDALRGAVKLGPSALRDTPLLDMTTPVANKALIIGASGTGVVMGPDAADIAAAQPNAAAAAASAAAAAASEAAALAAENSLLEWKGNWVTATAYAPSDIVHQDGNAYVCLVAHTSGVFATDLGSARWGLFAAKGAPGAGTGDVLAANNGSEFTASSFAANLGLRIFDTTPAAYDANALAGNITVYASSLTNGVGVVGGTFGVLEQFEYSPTHKHQRLYLQRDPTNPAYNNSLWMRDMEAGVWSDWNRVALGFEVEQNVLLGKNYEPTDVTSSRSPNQWHSNPEEVPIEVIITASTNTTTAVNYRKVGDTGSGVRCGGFPGVNRTMSTSFLLKPGWEYKLNNTATLDVKRTIETRLVTP